MCSRLTLSKSNCGCCFSVTQPCPVLCDPVDCSTPSFPVLYYLLEFVQTHVHWISDVIQPFHTLLPPSPPALIYIWIYIYVCVLSHFSCIQLCVTLWTVAHQAALSIGFSRQEYWYGLPCPPPGDLPNPGIEPVSLCLLHWQMHSWPLVLLGKAGHVPVSVKTK